MYYMYIFFPFSFFFPFPFPFSSFTSPPLLLLLFSSSIPFLSFPFSSFPFPFPFLYFSSSIPPLSFSLYSIIRKPTTRSKFNLNSSNSQRHFKIGHNLHTVFLHSFRYETTCRYEYDITTCLLQTTHPGICRNKSKK